MADQSSNASMMKYGLMLCLDAIDSVLPDDATTHFDMTFLSAFSKRDTLFWQSPVWMLPALPKRPIMGVFNTETPSAEALHPIDKQEMPSSGAARSHSQPFRRDT